MTQNRVNSTIADNFVVAGKNAVINGGMDIWARGTSFALTNPGTAYTADRWLGRHLGTNVTYSQQTSGLTGFQYSLRIQRPNGVTGTNDMAIYYNMESADSYRFAGQTVTLSYWAKVGANYSSSSSLFSVGIYSGTGTNQNITTGAYTGQVTVASETKTGTTSWQRFTTTGTVGSTATQIALIFSYVPIGTAGANDWLEIDGIQLELGSVATPFARAGGTIQGELAACQRYYYRQGGDDVYQQFGLGTFTSSTAAVVNVTLPVQMRVAPTAIDFSTCALADNVSATTSITALTFNRNSKTFVSLNATGSSGWTANRPANLTANNSTSAYVGLSAEL